MIISKHRSLDKAAAYLITVIFVNKFEHIYHSFLQLFLCLHSGELI